MRRSPLLPIFLIVLVDVLGLTIIIPLLAIYSERFGASPLVASLLIPSYAVCQLVAGPILGSLSDRVGRRRVLILSQFGTLLGFIILARADALWMLFLGRVLDGATAGNLTVAQAYIADHTPPEKRASSFALIGIAFGLGFTVGPAISAALAGYGLAAPFWLAAGLSALSILGTTFLLPKDPPRTPAPGEAKRPSVFDLGAYARYFRTPVLGRRLVQFFVYMCAFSMFTGGFALYAERHLVWDGHFFTVREIGFTFALSGVIGAVIQGGFIRRLVPRFGEAAIASAGFLAFAAGYVLLGASAAIAVLAAATVLSAMGNAVLRPCLTALISRLADPREQGAVLGVTQSLSSVAAVAAPPLAGFLIGHDLGREWTLVAAGFAVLGFLIMPRANPRPAAT
ncbi:MAG: MFS transporter [Kofleriaceae bacterium]